MERKTGTIIIFACTILVALVIGFFGAGAVISALEKDKPDDGGSSVFAPPTTAPPSQAPEPEDTGDPSPVVTTTPPTPTPESPSTQEGAVLEDLTAILDGYFKDTTFAPTSKWSVYAMDVESGSYAFSKDTNSGDDPTIAASLIKLFIAGAVYQEAQDDAARRDEIPAGDIFTIGDVTRGYLEVMLRDSDNASANQLIASLGDGGDFQSGMDKVTAFAKSIGCTGTELNRRLVPTEPVDGENYTTAQDCATALRMIAQGTFVSEEASEEIYSWLLADSSNPNKASKIRAGISDPGVKVANKTGENDAEKDGRPIVIENDAAIITAANAQYVLCIMSNPTNHAGAKEVMAEITKLVHAYFSK